MLNPANPANLSEAIYEKAKIWEQMTDLERDFLAGMQVNWGEHNPVYQSVVGTGLCVYVTENDMWYGRRIGVYVSNQTTEPAPHCVPPRESLDF